MALFSGYNPIALDSQKRLAVPARYREAVQTESDNCVVVTLGLDSKKPFLELYPLPEWKNKIATISELPGLHPITQVLQRRVVGHATPLSVDKNARILIPQALRELAGIDKEVVLAGVGKKFELWNASTWNETIESDLSSIDFSNLPDAFKGLT